MIAAEKTKTQTDTRTVREKADLKQTITKMP
jgi:hypothetical protein